MGLTLHGKVEFDGSGIGTGVQRGVNSAIGQLGGLKSALIGALGIASIEQMVRGTIEWASKLRDTADNLGVNVEWLQKMQNGAKLTGASIDDLSKFMGKLNQSRQAALQHPGQAQDKAFGRLGVSTSDIAGLSTKDFFEKIVTAFKDGATTQSVNDVSLVGGKSARNLIGAFATQFQNDIPILSEAMIDQLHDIGDEFDSLKTTLMVDLAPAILLVVEGLKTFINYIQQVGALLGGFSKDKKTVVGDALLTMVNPAIGLVKTAHDIANSSEAGQAAIDVEDSQKKSQAAIDAGLKAQRDARHRRENSSPGFDPITLKPTKSSGKPYSDEFTAVGNFLGAGSSVINSIAEKQLSETQKTNALLSSTNSLLQSIADGGGADYE